MKKILLLLSLFTLMATVTFGQERLRTRNYTERPDTEPPYDKPLPVGVKVKKPSTSTARTGTLGKTRGIPDSLPDTREFTKAKPINPGASSRRKSPPRRPGGRK